MPFRRPRSLLRNAVRQSNIFQTGSSKSIKCGRRVTTRHPERQRAMMDTWWCHHISSTVEYHAFFQASKGVDDISSGFSRVWGGAAAVHAAPIFQPAACSQFVRCDSTACITLSSHEVRITHQNIRGRGNHVADRHACQRQVTASCASGSPHRPCAHAWAPPGQGSWP